MRKLFIFLALVVPAAAEVRILDAEMHHLRFGEREWSEFPEEAEADRLQLAFEAKANDAEQTLILRQQDVKQQWVVTLNGKPIGKLRVDENDMIEAFAIPPGGLVDGENRLLIEQPRLRKRTPDDIRVGEIKLESRPPKQAFNEAKVVVAVRDPDGLPLPARLTVLNADGALQKVGAESNDHLAVRPGLVYTSTGQAVFGVPAGSYKIIAGRGFEYSIDEAEFEAKGDQIAETKLTIERVVDTTGYVACDPHVHTLTHSGHGDATVQERMITLAAEGIELPIATDHNVHIDHESFAKEMNVRQYFTPVIGNEVTTKVGHFNIWPITSDQVSPPDWKSMVWDEIFDGIFATDGVKVCILNHGRDLHGGTTPLGQKLHNAYAGQNVEGWELRANGMECVNSGATQSTILTLFYDWTRMLNRGLKITPVGSSDSHDVARHFVGQGRTYIRVDDSDVSNIDISAAADAFIAGNVLMSYGLIADLRVIDAQPGETATVKPGEELKLVARVLGPEWVDADSILLLANGEIAHSQIIESNRKQPGVIWEGEIPYTVPNNDVHLAFIAQGPGVGLHWSTAKPYKPDFKEWTPKVLGCSGAIWLDVDGDGQTTSARGYAEMVYTESNGDFSRIQTALAEYHPTVAVQMANLLYRKDEWPGDEVVEKMEGKVGVAFRHFLHWQHKSEAAE